jgi:hypothetical protein
MTTSGRLAGIGLTLALATLFLTSGCTTKVRINMLKPATYHQASLTKTVAVVPFDGPGGAEFAAEVEGVLSSINIDDRQYFTVVDRASLDKVINELKFSQSGLIDQGTAARIGKMVGAQGIYTGIVSVSGCETTNYREQRRTCEEWEKKKDKDGRTYEGDCIRWKTYSVKCTKRVANFAVTPKLIDVATGKVIYSRNLSATTSSDGCSDKTLARSENELMKHVKGSVKAKFRKDIAPYYVTQEIRIMDDADGIESKEAKDKLKTGVEFADKGRMDAACERWGAARILAPSSFSILYNLGVCAESRGDAEAAQALYVQADRIYGKPDDDITLALARVAATIKDRKKLEEQLKSK